MPEPEDLLDTAGLSVIEQQAERREVLAAVVITAVALGVMLVASVLLILASRG